MKSNAKTIDELIETSMNPQLMNQVDQFMISEFSNLDRYLFVSESITLIGYGRMTKMDRGEHDFWPLIAMAPQKNNISIYIVGQKGNTSILQSYAHYFAKSATGKSCLRVKKSIDLDILKQMVNDAIEWYEQLKVNA